MFSFIATIIFVLLSAFLFNALNSFTDLVALLIAIAGFVSFACAMWFYFATVNDFYEWRTRIPDDFGD